MRSVTVTEQSIRNAAVSLVRKKGYEALNARALAKRLGCSTQPIFRCFGSMQALRKAVLEDVHARYLAFIEAYMAQSDAPAYKASGLGYIAFAREEPRLFSLLFMRDRRGEADSPEEPDWPRFVALAQDRTGLDPSNAELLHLELWAVCHGIAAMLATSYLPLEEQAVSRMLSDVFLGLQARKENANERN